MQNRKTNTETDQKRKAYNPDHEEIKEKIQEYLDKGGKITVLPPEPDDTRKQFFTTEKPKWLKYNLN